MFDWLHFFQQNNTPYRTAGANVSKGNAVLRCPWCGVSDEGEHLVVNLQGRGFKCWRQPLHSGKNPAKLIQALLNCSWEQANSIAGQSKSLPNDFMNKVRQSIQKQEMVQQPNKLKLPIEFKKFSTLPSCRMYLSYINSRGFTIKDTNEYQIYYASLGPYKGRVIFPVYFEGNLVGWTGRTIFPSEQIRYKTLTNDLEKAKENGETPAPAPISDYLLWYDKLVETDADTIVLCEGPFDAFKVNVLGKYLGVVSTAFFTSTMSKAQANLLHQILPKFKNRFLLLDQQGTFSKAQRIKADLSSLNVIVKQLPKNIEDPGAVKTVGELKNMLAIV